MLSAASVDRDAAFWSFVDLLSPGSNAPCGNAAASSILPHCALCLVYHFQFLVDYQPSGLPGRCAAKHASCHISTFTIQRSVGRASAPALEKGPHVCTEPDKTDCCPLWTPTFVPSGNAASCCSVLRCTALFCPVLCWDCSVLHCVALGSKLSVLSMLSRQRQHCDSRRYVLQSTVLRSCCVAADTSAVVSCLVMLVHCGLCHNPVERAGYPIVGVCSAAPMIDACECATRDGGVWCC